MAAAVDIRWNRPALARVLAAAADKIIPDVTAEAAQLAEAAAPATMAGTFTAGPDRFGTSSSFWHLFEYGYHTAPLYAPLRSAAFAVADRVDLTPR